MKKVLLMIAVVVTAVSCGDLEPDDRAASRDPDDITGFYDVNYRMYVDGTPVSLGVIPGRVEVVGEPGTEISLDFYPDNAILKFPPWDHDTPRESLSMWPIRTEGPKGNYSFDYEGGVTLEITDSHYTSSTMIASGSIVAKGVKEPTTDNGYSDFAADMATIISDSPDFYHDIGMTIEMTMPLGGEIFRDIRIEIESRRISGDRVPDRRP